MLNAQFALVLCATNGFSHAMNHVKYRLSSLRKEHPFDSKEQLVLDTALAAYEFRFGDSMLADRILARVLATGEAPTEAILMKAERYFEQQRGAAARELLDRVVQMEPRDPRPLALLSRLYLCFDEEEGAPWALALAKRACELSEWQNPSCLQLIAECYEALDDKNAFELIYPSQYKFRPLGRH
jgi:predicted Zn-dependent protease